MAAERAGRRRPRLAWGSGLASCALVLAVLPASAGSTAVFTAGSTAVSTAGSPAARASGDRPYSGFAISDTGKAAGEWIGARKVGRNPGRVVYRIDPGAREKPGGLGGQQAVSRLRGGGKRSSASTGATARAAWILSKYGTFRYGIQSAAVDAAVLHLVAGGPWRVRGKQGAARLRQSGQASSVRDFALTMLRDSRTLAGPYRVTAQQVGQSVVGDDLTLAVGARVARSGRALPSVPVVVRAGTATWHDAGRTDDAGRTTYPLTGLPAGPHEVTVRVRRVPETRLLLLEPRRRGSSRDALAGRKTVLSQGVQVVVTARPRVRVGASWIARNTQTRARLTISEAYGSSPRPATAVLHGPFGSRQQATCQRKQLRVRHPTVTGNGSIDLPGVTLRRAGFYAWYVGVPADDYNLNATTCAGIFKVKPD